MRYNNWYVLYVRTNHERKVSTHIKRLNIISYLPIKNCLRSWSDRVKEISVPLFPSYLFLNAEYKELLGSLSHPSVINYVKYDGKPAVISEAQINAIRKLEYENLEYSIESQCLSNNSLVKVMVGPLKGIIGRISTINSNSYIILDLQELKQSIRIRINKEDVSACHEIE